MSNQLQQLNISNLFYPKYVLLQNVNQLNLIYQLYFLKIPKNEFIKSIQITTKKLNLTVLTTNADDSSTGGKHVAMVNILTN